MKLLYLAYRKFHNLKIRTKLIISYILLITIPSVIMGYIYFDTSSNIVSSNASGNIYNLVKKSNDIIDARLTHVENSIIFSHIDEDLFYLFNRPAPESFSDLSAMDKKLTNIVYRYFPTLEDVYSVNFITSYYIFGRTVLSRFPEGGEQVYRFYGADEPASGRPRWIPTYDLQALFGESEKKGIRQDSQYVFSATKILNPTLSGTTSYSNMSDAYEKPRIVVNFKESMLKQVFSGISSIEGSRYCILTTEGIVVSDPEPSLIGTKADGEWADDIIGRKTGIDYKYIHNEKNLVLFDDMKTTGWISVIIIPYDKLLSTLPVIRYYTIYMGLILLSISILVAFLLSGMIIKPIRKLLEAINRIGDGKFSSRVEIDSSDELGYLTRKFNEMNDKIVNLIEENYVTKIKEKDAQLMALNFQVNPHFLYNTLNTINCIALENKQKEISKMLVSLSELLRYTVKNNKKTVPFRQEFEYLKNYVFIMMNRFEGRFVFETDIQPEIYDIQVPNFFLQPFVENSVIHGLEDVEKDGIIKVSARIENNTAVFCVEDNGKGIRADDLPEYTGEKAKSIGISNVDNRIKLLFGRQYGVNIVSEEGAGTKVFITIPRGPDPEENPLL